MQWSKDMKNTWLKILAAITYVAMVTMNYLAVALPLNNRSTGQISDAYPNLFAPAGLTFSIWGLIYLLLGGYVVYQFLNKNKTMEGVIKKINPLFIASSLCNFLWIFAWHYDYIAVSVVIMATLLVLLIKIADCLRQEKFTMLEKILVWAPFSIYFGWITVAAIANITIFLVSIDWNGFGVADFVWTCIILAVGALIGSWRMSHDKNIAYGLVLVWAYLGILLKHVSVDGFNGQYQSVITTIIVCLVLFVVIGGRILLEKENDKMVLR